MSGFKILLITVAGDCSCGASGEEGIEIDSVGGVGWCPNMACDKEYRLEIDRNEDNDYSVRVEGAKAEGEVE